MEALIIRYLQKYFNTKFFAFTQKLSTTFQPPPATLPRNLKISHPTPPNGPTLHLGFVFFKTRRYLRSA